MFKLNFIKIQLTFILFSVTFNFFSQSLTQTEKKIFFNKRIKKIDYNNPLIFLDFWATWCAPCVASLPHTQELQQKFNNDVSFVFITDEPLFKIKNFIKKNSFNLSILIDNEQKTSSEFNVTSIPRSFLIGPEGNILWEGKPTEMDAKLLENFVFVNKNYKGNKNRYKKYVIKNVIQDWKKDKVSNLKFNQVDFIENNFYRENGIFYLSGSLSYIYSFLYDVDEKFIINNASPVYFEFKLKSNNLDLFKKNVMDFLTSQYSYHINKRYIKTIFFEIKDTSDKNFLSKYMFDYGKGNNQFLKSDVSIKVDNASPKKLFEILNKLTPYEFKYVGHNFKIYDWSIIYLSEKLILQQLTEDLDFKITKKNHQIYQYIIEKK